MEKIEYRILGLGIILITGRRINRHPALHSECRTIVPNLGNSSVRDIIDTIQITLAALHDKNIIHTVHIAIHVDIQRVCHLKTIHDKTIAVQLRIQLAGSKFPDTFIAFLKVSNSIAIGISILDEIAHNLHPHRLRCFKSESYSVVRMNLWRNEGVDAPNCLLRKSRSRQHQCCRKCKDFFHVYVNVFVSSSCVFPNTGPSTKIMIPVRNTSRFQDMP